MHGSHIVVGLALTLLLRAVSVQPGVTITLLLPLTPSVPTHTHAVADRRYGGGGAANAQSDSSGDEMNDSMEL
jgi:hypothetical protein